MNRILIIRACAIGDFVLNLPAVQALHRAWDDVRFTFVGYPPTLDLARNFVPIDGIYSIEREPWSRLFYESTGGLSFESAVVWMKDPVVASNLRRSGVPNVFRADPFPEYGHAATHLLRTLGLPEPPLPDLWKQEAPDIVINASSGSPLKNWPYFDELTARLRDSCFSLKEGHFTLTEVSQRLRYCRAYIGNDSGITHLAGYLGVPTIALFGPTNPRTWGPIGRRTRIIWKTKLEDISVDEVLKTLKWQT
jgi:Glycosyltransferase family 9 (heptosyltransferase)